LRQLNTIGRYFRAKFGCSVYKIPISISGFTCPNIDGTVARGGCSFCENDSFSPNLAKQKEKFKLHPLVQNNPYLDYQIQQLKFQFNSTKTRLQKKFKAKKFIIYFQSFTNTYAPIETLKALYEAALQLEDVIGLSIGTRSDCVSDEILAYLASLQNNGKEIWIEYGVQSIFDETLIKINRGHDFENTRYWIQKTKEYNLKVCAHLIFGLPDETKEMMLKTTSKMVELGVKSIKFHPLYVVKNTLLTNEYLMGNFTPITEEDYIDILINALLLLSPDVIVQRVSAGINNDSLLAPLWCNSKSIQINNIRKALILHQIDY